MRDNPVQFAVVREDPRVELELARACGAERALLVASGGCTALALAALRPDLEVSLFDVNPAQIELVERKFAALMADDRDPALWTVGVDDAGGLNACGNFESLFRSLRRFLEEFVIPREELLQAFREGSAFDATVVRLVEHRFWTAAFDAHFHDGLLESMFGAAAIQHAPPGSYPRHFRNAFERGLRREDAVRNRFLHHVLLGHYVDAPGALPPYLASGRVPVSAPESVLGSLQDVAELERFDLISLSNLTDWMSDAETADLARDLTLRARRGCVAVFRMLNTSSRICEQLGPAWTIERELASDLHRSSRALFYSDLLVARKR